MFPRLILGTVFLIIPSVISNLVVEDDLFEAHLEPDLLDTDGGSGAEGYKTSRTETAGDIFR